MCCLEHNCEHFYLIFKLFLVFLCSMVGNSYLQVCDSFVKVARGEHFLLLLSETQL